MFLGHYSEGGTPVLISNTEVKPFSAYGTCGLPCWESRSWPRTIDIAFFKVFNQILTIFQSLSSTYYMSVI